MSDQSTRQTCCCNYDFCNGSSSIHNTNIYALVVVIMISYSCYDSLLCLLAEILSALLSHLSVVRLSRWYACLWSPVDRISALECIQHPVLQKRRPEPEDLNTILTCLPLGFAHSFWTIWINMRLLSDLLTYHFVKWERQKGQYQCDCMIHTQHQRLRSRSTIDRNKLGSYEPSDGTHCDTENANIVWFCFWSYCTCMKLHVVSNTQYIRNQRFASIPIVLHSSRIQK